MRFCCRLLRIGKSAIVWKTTTSCINKVRPPTTHPAPRMCSNTTQTLEPYQTSSKHCWHRHDNLFMYGKLYEADHKLQVTYGFFFPPWRDATGKWMHGRSQCQRAHCLSVTSERARLMSDQCFWPWRKAVIQHQHELHSLPFCSLSICSSVSESTAALTLYFQQ